MKTITLTREEAEAALTKECDCMAIGPEGDPIHDRRCDCDGRGWTPGVFYREMDPQPMGSEPPIRIGNTGTWADAAMAKTARPRWHSPFRHGEVVRIEWADDRLEIAGIRHPTGWPTYEDVTILSVEPEECDGIECEDGNDPRVRPCYRWKMTTGRVEQPQPQEN